MNDRFYRVYRPEWCAFDELVTKHSADSSDFFFIQIGANDGVTAQRRAVGVPGIGISCPAVVIT